MASFTRWGCLPAIASALLSGLLLFLNGAVVLAIINAFSSTRSRLVDFVVQNEKWTQFLVLCGPVILLILEWMMFDYLRSVLTQRTSSDRDISRSNGGYAESTKPGN